MRTIMTLNAKGGCGKSTLATNLAAYYASQGKSVALVDFDPQLSSLNWLAARPEQRNPIHGIDGSIGSIRFPRETEMVIMDAPAGVHGKNLTALVRRAETLLVPVLPSPMDIRAGARFIHELLLVGRVDRKQTRVAVIANRVKEYTLAYQALSAFLDSLKIPVVATLRDTQNYIRAAERGMGIHEMAPSLMAPDVEQWEPLIKWLRGRGSRPLA